MDGSYGNTAEYFSKFNSNRFRTISVLAPYEPKDKIVQWVRGNIRYNNGDGAGPRDLIITGPKLKVCYGQCRWNRLVFAMNGTADSEVFHFEQWLTSLADHIRSQIWANPNKYKSGSMTSQRFHFDGGFIKPSSDPIVYPDELQTKLSTVRVMNNTSNHFNDIPSYTEVCDADIFMDGPDGPIVVKPEEITAGSHIIPIIRISYNRNIEKFGLVLTVLKAKYFPSEYIPIDKISNDSWTFDMSD